MPYLLDTNILARLAQPLAPEYPTAQAAISRLMSAGEGLHICPQVLVEFWSIATRPPGSPSNGLGMTPQQAEAEVQQALTLFVLIPDPPTLFDAWHRLVVMLGVQGRQVHDARLAAFMKESGLTDILTFNIRHFRRFPNIRAVDPNSV